MRVHLHTTKNSSWANIQMSKSLVSRVRSACNFLVTKVYGIKSVSQGSGWYRFYGNVKAEGRDLKEIIKRIRLKVFALRDMDRVADAIDPLAAVRLGLLNVPTNKHGRRLVVHKRGRISVVCDRALQACAGILSEIREAFTPKIAASSNKLLELKAKFE